MITQERRTGIHSISVLAMLGSLLLSACGPSIPHTQAEQEIGAFMLEFVIHQQIGETARYIESSGQPWVKAPPEANLIVWAPALGRLDHNGIEYLNAEAPLHVWWLAGTRLTEVTSDKAAAIADYRATHMQHPQSNIWAWGYYEYGILSLSNRNQEAQVYVGVSCGPLCGTGTIYTLERDASGKWEIRDSDMRWIS